MQMLVPLITTRAARLHCTGYCTRYGISVLQQLHKYLHQYGISLNYYFICAARAHVVTMTSFGHGLLPGVFQKEAIYMVQRRLAIEIEGT